MTKTSGPPRVLMIGAGTMGSALARALLSRGNHVTVWNRTESRVAALISDGAFAAATLVDGFRAADVIFVCVSDQGVSRSLLSDPVIESEISGKTIVQFTTGTADERRQHAWWAHDLEARYLDVAVMAYPFDVGTDAAVILCSGDRLVYSEVSPLLMACGMVRFLGADPGGASILDAALLALFYGSLAGFIQGAALLRANGVELGDYLDLSQHILANFLANALRDAGERNQSGDYGSPQSALQTHLGGLDLVVGASRDAGVVYEVFDVVRNTFREAISNGYGADDVAVLIDAWQHADPNV